MKKLNSKMAVIALVTLFFAILPSISKAQIAYPYRVTNNLNCSAVVSWQAYNGGSACGTSSSHTIPAGTTYYIPASNFVGCGATLSDIYITAQQGSNASSTAHGPIITNDVSINVNSGCGSLNALIHWQTTGFDIFQ